MTDPIVEETHRVRDRLLAECGNDLQALADLHSRLAAVSPERQITLEEFRLRYGRQPRAVKRIESARSQ